MSPKHCIEMVRATIRICSSIRESQRYDWESLSRCCRITTLLILLVDCAAMAESQQYPVFGLQFSPDGKLLAAASSLNNPPGPIIIWNVGDWSVLHVHRPTKGSLDIEFSSDGTRLAYGTKSGIVGILNVASGNVVREIPAHKKAVFSVAFTPDGKSLVSGSEDRTTKLWNLLTGELVRSYDIHNNTVDGVAISPDGTLLLTGGNDSQVVLSDFPAGAVRKTFKTGDSIVRRVGFSRDGKYFWSCSWDNYTRIRETSTGQIRAILEPGSNCADMTADNRLVVAAAHDSAAHVFSVDLREPNSDEQQSIAGLLKQFQDEKYEVRDAAAKELTRIGMIAETKLRVSMNDSDPEVRVRARWLHDKVISPHPIAKLASHRGPVEVVCLSPDGHLIATASRRGEVKVWDSATFQEMKTLDVSIVVDKRN